jgi:hypothetical protein
MTVFDAPQVLPGAENHVMYDMTVAVRPTDGKAFIVGTSTGHVWFGRLGGQPVQDIHGSSGGRAGNWPTLTFGNDGTGYVGWRDGDSWDTWCVTVPPIWDGGALPAPRDISAAMSAAAGAKNVTQADFAASRKTGKLYAAAFVDYGSYATTGFFESSDGGRTWGGYTELARDYTRSNQSPRIAVGRDTDNVHVIVRNNDNLVEISRFNGQWDASPQLLGGGGEKDWDIRSQDGKVTKAIAEAKSGTVVAAWKHPATTSIAVAIRKPDQPWQIMTKSLPGNMKPQTVALSGTPGGDMCMLVQQENPPFGAFLYVLPALNDTFGPQNIIEIKTEPSWGMAGCGIDATAYGGRIWLAWTVGRNLPERTYFTSAPYDGTIPATPPVITPPPVVVTPPPVVAPPLPPVNEFLPPSSISAEAKSFNQVAIYWKDKTLDEVEFSVERKEKDIPYRIVGSAAANATQWLDVIGIEPEVKYTYRVRAHKTGVYSSYSMEVSTVTPAKPVEPAPVPVPQPKPQPAPVPVPVDPNIVIKNGFQLGHGFLAYWNKFVMPDTPHPLGLPKSNEQDYVDENGKKYVIQVFERAVLGYDAAEANERYRVQPILIGADWLKRHIK